MKKVTVVVSIFLVMITLRSFCGADDKSGYIVKDLFTFHLP